MSKRAQKGKCSNNCVKSCVNPHFPDGCPRIDTHDLKNKRRRDDQSKKWDIIDRYSAYIS